MYPKQHLFGGLFLSLVLLIIFPQIGLIGFLIIALSNVLVDTDHYIYYIFKKKDFNLKKAYHWFIERRKIVDSLSKEERKKYKRDILIFHGFEFLLLILFFYLTIDKVFFWVFLGTTIHMASDFIEGIYHKNPIFFKFSQLYNYIKNRNKKELE